MGKRLKTARAIFIVANEYSENTIRGFVFSGSILNIIDVKKANNRFDNGPAKATIAVYNSLFLKLYSLIGTGLLHPNLNRTMHTAPIGSICFNGFNVNLPSALAVISPSLNALNACAYSCTVDAMRIDGIATSTQYVYSDNSCIIKLDK